MLNPLPGESTRESKQKANELVRKTVPGNVGHLERNVGICNVLHINVLHIAVTLPSMSRLLGKIRPNVTLAVLSRRERLINIHLSNSFRL